MFSSDAGGDRSYRTFSGHDAGVLYATFSYKGDEVMSCSSDGSIKVLSFVLCLLNNSVFFAICLTHWPWNSFIKYKCIGKAYHIA
jgi:WD40 repeat protein